jgi:hypothetical protein
MANTYVLIASNVVGSGGTSSISFSSISSSYTDIKLVWSSRSSDNNLDMGIAYNGSGASVSSKILWVTTGGSVTNESNAYAYYVMNPSASTSNTFSSGELYMPNYAGSNNKSFGVDMATENNSSTGIRMGIEAGINASSAAISSLTITPNAGNFVQYSSFYLYGIKNS